MLQTCCKLFFLHGTRPPAVVVPTCVPPPETGKRKAPTEAGAVGICLIVCVIAAFEFAGEQLDDLVEEAEDARP